MERIGAKRSVQKKRTQVPIVLQASQRGPRRRFIKGGVILTVIERDVARGAARQNAHYVKAAADVPKNRAGMTICSFVRFASFLFLLRRGWSSGYVKTEGNSHLDCRVWRRDE